MPIFISAWIEMLDQARRGKKLKQHTFNLKQWLISDPLSMVPKSRRAQAELNLRTAEYLAMIGQDTISTSDIKKQEQMIMDAQINAEAEAAAKLETEKDRLESKAASKLDIAHLAADILKLGRTWSEHFNIWSVSRENALEVDRSAAKEDIKKLRGDMEAMQKQIDQLYETVRFLQEDR